MRFAVKEINKSIGKPKKYQKEIPKKVKREVGNHELAFRTSSAIKTFSVSIRNLHLLELQQIIGRTNVRPEVIALSLKK